MAVVVPSWVPADRTVEARDVADFVRRYYKSERIRDLFDLLVASREECIAEFGYCCISHYDSVTGDGVYFIPATKES